MPEKNHNVVFCDGGLCNRLNALVFAHILEHRFGGGWDVCWPVNNWCGAAFDALFSVRSVVCDHPLDYYKEREMSYRVVVHENQCGFSAERIHLQRDMNGFDDYVSLLKDELPLFYYHNLIPACAGLDDISSALGRLSVREDILTTARNFCRQHAIDENVIGLHIRKTDFGNAVDDESLFKLVEKSPQRFFVCSDDAEVNSRFAALSNCVVFEKSSYPLKVVEGGWNARTVDDQGRVFGFNITRSSDSIVEALVDLLILSRTTLVSTSSSTFLRMAMLFKASNFFTLRQEDGHV